LQNSEPEFSKIPVRFLQRNRLRKTGYSVFRHHHIQPLIKPVHRHLLQLRPRLKRTAICRIFLAKERAMPTPHRQSRLEARIAPDVHDILKRAAEIEGRSLTDFVVAAASAAARATIAQTEMISLSRESAAAFASLLADPRPPAPAMERARAHHERLIGPL
jgi:uncharacterized protein (DUF1778 family)